MMGRDALYAMNVFAAGHLPQRNQHGERSQHCDPMSWMLETNAAQYSAPRSTCNDRRCHGRLHVSVETRYELTQNERGHDTLDGA